MATDASEAVTAVNALAPEGLVARVTPTATRQYQFDLQGSVCQRLDGSGNVLSTASYNAWSRGTDGDPNDPFAYNGRWGYYYDRESQFFLCGRRHMDDLGRWVTRDPIEVAGERSSGTSLRIDPQNGALSLSWVVADTPVVFTHNIMNTFVVGGRA